MSDKTKDKEVEQMDGKSKDVWEEKQKRLEDVLPGVLSEGEVDVEKLKKLIGEGNIARGERYSFTWAGKSDAIQEIKKRTTATLKPNIEESVNFEDTENLFIEGENLEVLRALQKAYYGKVKMIYIDPPYNTGNDFVYNDNFSESVEDYNGKTGDMDENGKMIRALQKNTKEKGHYHSNWLSMMYPRLFLAKNLLKEDGVIFVSINDVEVHNLRMIMNEIFGEENFVEQVVRVAKTTSFRGNYFAPSKDYILCFAREKSNLPRFKGEIDESQYDKIEEEGPRKGERYRDDTAFYLTTLETRPNQRYFIECPDGQKVIPPGETFPPEDPKSGDGVWRWNKEQFKKKKHLISFKKSSRSPLIDENGEQADWNIYTKSYLEDKKEKGNLPRDFITDYLNRHGTKRLKELNIPYDFPKPVGLIKHLMKISGVGNEDVVLDFFAGSATTADAVMDLNSEDQENRRFIMIQLPEKTEEDSDARKAGFETIPDIGKERIRRASEKIKEDNPEIEEGQYDFGFKSFELTDSNFRNWVKQEIEDEEELQQKLEEIIDNVKEETRKENMLYELMFKLGLNPNVELEEKDDYYRLLDGEYLISLADEIDSDLAETFLDEDPRVVVCLDKAFKGDDELKTNTALQMQSEEITFKVV